MLDISWHIEQISYYHGNQYRKWDSSVPYALHPIWCATMILSEKNLLADLRNTGAIALLYHDVPEDCQVAVVDLGVPDDIQDLVAAMSFVDFNDERKRLWDRQPFVILLKLYDKTSNLLDGHWMSDEKRSQYCEHVERIIEVVQPIYGDLQIVQLAKQLINASKSYHLS